MTVTLDEVKAIYSGASNLSDAQITAVINMVADISVEVLAPAGYSGSMQNAIERYLVAHYIAIGFDQGGVTRKRVGTSEEEYRTLPTTAVGLASTLFGQQAQALDIKGALAKMATNPVKAEFRVI